MLAQDGTIMNVLDWQIFLMIRGYALIVTVVTSIIFVSIWTLNLLRLHLVVQLFIGLGDVYFANKSFFYIF